jgi:Flagellar transcriptional activator (FlhC)
MNGTDDRAHRHWRRDQLALRMVRHGARSSTVSAWTGLSGNRIRTLVQRHGERPPVRHRGQPPRRVGYFFRTLRLTTHAAALGCDFELLEILPRTPGGLPAHHFPNIARGERLCVAYELYVATVESPLIGFEHAVLLATALAVGEEISLQPCPQCGAGMLVDHFAVTTDACTHCRPTAQLPAIPGIPAEALAPERFRRAQIQLTLFAPTAEELRPARRSHTGESSSTESAADPPPTDPTPRDTAAP